MVEYEVRLKMYPMHAPVSVRDINLIRAASISHDNIGIRYWAVALLSEFERSGHITIRSDKEQNMYFKLVLSGGK